MGKDYPLHFFGGAMALIAGLTAGLFSNYQTDQRPVDIDGDGRMDTVSTYLFGPLLFSLQGKRTARQSTGEHQKNTGLHGDAKERKKQMRQKGKYMKT